MKITLEEPIDGYEASAELRKVVVKEPVWNPYTKSVDIIDAMDDPEAIYVVLTPNLKWVEATKEDCAFAVTKGFLKARDPLSEKDLWLAGGYQNAKGVFLFVDQNGICYERLQVQK